MNEPKEKKKSILSERLASLDALRGFDMFWIMGGEGIFHALAKLTGWSAFVWGKKKWAFFFIVIGLNPITIYLVQRGIISFRRTSDFFFSGLIGYFPESSHDLLNAIGYMAMSWLFLYILYRLRIFLRV